MSKIVREAKPVKLHLTLMWEVLATPLKVYLLLTLASNELMMDLQSANVVNITIGEITCQLWQLN